VLRALGLRAGAPPASLGSQEMGKTCLCSTFMCCSLGLQEAEALVTSAAQVTCVCCTFVRCKLFCSQEEETLVCAARLRAANFLFMRRGKHLCVLRAGRTVCLQLGPCKLVASGGTGAAGTPRDGHLPGARMRARMQMCECVCAHVKRVAL